MHNVPNDLEAERAVLGACMVSVDAYLEVATVLEAEDFYFPAHRHLWTAICDLEKKSQPVDCLTIADQLRANDKIDTLTHDGGVQYLVSLVESVVTARNVAHHARIVKAKSTRRQWSASALKINGIVTADDGDDDLSIADAEKVVLELQGRKRGDAPEHIRVTLHLLSQDLDYRYTNQKLNPITGVPSGFSMLDSSTSGFQPADLVVLAARPSMGKTAWAMNAVLAAAQKKIPALVFSLEMSKKSLVERMVATEGRVDGMEMKTGRMSTLSLIRINKAYTSLCDLPVSIYDKGGTSISDIRSIARRWRMMEAKDSKNALVVIDHLQLITAPEYDRNQNQNLKIGAITGQLKALAKDLNCPVMVLSQLNRGCDQRQDKRPMLSDLRDSGCIEQDADTVIMLYRDDYYNAESDDGGVAEILIAKQRNGQTGMIRLNWIPEQSRFEDRREA